MKKKLVKEKSIKKPLKKDSPEFYLGKIKIPQIKIPAIPIKNRYWRIVFWAVVSLVIIYLLTGVGFAIATYRYHSQDKATKFAAEIYPFPVAWFGRDPIWIKDYYQLDKYLQKYHQESEQPLPDEEVLKDLITGQLIDINLHQKILKKYHVTVSKEEIDQAYNKIEEDYIQKAKESGEEEKDMAELLKMMYNMSTDELRQLIRNQLTIEKVKNELFSWVKVRHIVIKDESPAKEVLDKVKAGEDFSELAKKYSQDIENNELGGSLGQIWKGDLMPELSEVGKVAFSLNSGEFSQELVKTEKFGYHIIKVDEKHDGVIDQNYDQWYEETKNNSNLRKWY